MHPYAIYPRAAPRKQEGEDIDPSADSAKHRALRVLRIFLLNETVRG